MIATDQFMAALRLPEVYRVGGSVRDELLGRDAKDGDYVVRGASLEEIAQRLVECAAIANPLRLRDGRQIGFRAVTQRFGAIEIVLPRREDSTGPGHRDFRIAIDKNLSLEHDARRRDFTINALYKNLETGEILDPLGEGRDDLGNQRIQTTHPDSFRDDPLRTLRALRFVSQLGFWISHPTWHQMRLHAKSVNALTLKGVSGTALTEFEGLLMGRWAANALRNMRDTRVMEVLLPELSSMVDFEQRSTYHDKKCDEHVFDAVEWAAINEAPLRVRMALLFHDAGKPWMAWTDSVGFKHYYALTASQIRDVAAPPTALHSHEWWGAWLARRALDRLNAPAALKSDVVTLIDRHMLPLHERVRPMKVRKWRAELGDDMLADLINHRWYDVLGKGGDVTEAEVALGKIKLEQQHAIETRIPRCVKELAITGNDLRRLGIEGPAIGEILRQLLHEAMAQPKLNEHEALMSRAAALARVVP